MSLTSSREVYVAGRAKEMFIIMRHNCYPEDFEQIAGRQDGVQEDRCVAFARPENDADIVLVVEAADAAESMMSRCRYATPSPTLSALPRSMSLSFLPERSRRRIPASSS